MLYTVTYIPSPSRPLASGTCTRCIRVIRSYSSQRYNAREIANQKWRLNRALDWTLQVLFFGNEERFCCAFVRRALCKMRLNSIIIFACEVLYIWKAIFHDICKSIEQAFLFLACARTLYSIFVLSYSCDESNGSLLKVWNISSCVSSTASLLMRRCTYARLFETFDIAVDIVDWCLKTFNNNSSLE